MNTESGNKRPRQEDAKPVNPSSKPVGAAASIFGEPFPNQDLLHQVVLFFVRNVDSPQVEVEAKLGVLIDTASNARACSLIPIASEAILHPEATVGVRFESAVDLNAYKELNMRLNKRTEVSARGDAANRIKYARSCERVELLRDNVRRVHAMDRQRKPLDKPPRLERKTRMEDLNIVEPNHLFDLRLSASREEPIDESSLSNSSASGERIKERVSYRFRDFSVDLTSVQPGGAKPAGAAAAAVYEVEIEADAEGAAAAVARYREGETGDLLRICTEMLGNIYALLACAESVHNNT